MDSLHNYLEDHKPPKKFISCWVNPKLSYQPHDLFFDSEEHEYFDSHRRRAMKIHTFSNLKVKRSRFLNEISERKMLEKKNFEQEMQTLRQSLFFHPKINNPIFRNSYPIVLYKKENDITTNNFSLSKFSIEKYSLRKLGIQYLLRILEIPSQNPNFDDDLYSD